MINSKISSKEISVKKVVAESDITSFTQTPNKVYALRKVQKVSQLARKIMFYPQTLSYAETTLKQILPQELCLPQRFSSVELLW